MPHKPRKIESMLLNKYGFQRAKNRSKDHRCYVLTVEGLPPIHTKVSHAKRDIGPGLLTKIARQLRVGRSFLDLMLKCTKTATEYIDKVRTEPEPPFDIIV
jgi:predicted RNA binding protein YcfA (HicA-like mRNA interferase family)